MDSTTWIIIGSIFAILALVGAVFFLERHLRRRRRARLMDQAMPPEWATILRDNFPLYRRIPDDIKTALHRQMHVFLAEKSFEGCAGVELTGEMRVTIAAQACLLLLNGRGDFFPRLQSVLIYPGEYLNRQAGVFSSDQVMHDDRRLIGESWDSGSVVLSWRHARQGGRNPEDGINVVFHEFAHQLDQVSGDADGAPALSNHGRYRTWSKTMSEAFERLQRRVDRGQRTLFDDYGLTNPAEFFAVATETFFERGRRMKKEYPELYQEFCTFYALDPASWEIPEE